MPPQIEGRLPSDAIGVLEVEKFNTDELLAQVDVKRPAGVWLYYADAYHPGWISQVDGKPARIFTANGAFKAVFLEAGKHCVRFYFGSGLEAYVRNLSVMFGLIIGVS
jgi:hypothetical protein